MKFVVVNFCVRQNALLRKIADAWVGPLSAGGDLSAPKAGTYFIMTLSMAFPLDPPQLSCRRTQHRLRTPAMTGIAHRLAVDTHFGPIPGRSSSSRLMGCPSGLQR